ncbi:SDR family NAD(P)-dependent oxidoreductase [Iningainema tapete]|uniref:SDR family oxidoreductase n=1 Tax=Iningainema tapete BLCC-T55 TaxID=2748662 RepID=A0A8J6XDS1_9CYAN|nr:SDR family oxidoreductase [Iningainema tapete]MBD2774275.1 SDR family oxidoreductase [Iningainema tapete BLCC-T55]
MGKLDGKNAFIAGGTGGVGEGIVRAFLNEGATVAVPSRHQENLEELRSNLGDLACDRFIAVVGDMSDTDSAESLRDQVLAKIGHLDAVVASLNGRWDQDIPLLKTSLDDWKRMLDANLTSHFIAARTFLPVLQRGSTYTLIGGGAADQAIPNYGLVCIPAAGEIMLTQMLIQENKGSGVRINEVVLHSLIATRKQSGEERPELLTADEVGRYTAWLASDEANMVTSSIIRLYQHE